MTSACNTVTLSADRDTTAAARLRRYTSSAPPILKALPGHGEAPLSAREIASRAHVCISTTRNILGCAVKLGIAQFEEVPARCNAELMKVYTRAPALAPDDFEESRNVYAQEQEAEGVE